MRDEIDVERVFVVGLRGEVPEGFRDYEELLEGASSSWRAPEVKEGQAAGLCYTSGTTGKPKGVMYSHRALVLHSLASALPDQLGVSQRDVLLPVVPMFPRQRLGVAVHLRNGRLQAGHAGASFGRAELARPVREGARHDHRRRADDLDGDLAGARARAEEVVAAAGDDDDRRRFGRARGDDPGV